MDNKKDEITQENVDKNFEEDMNNKNNEISREDMDKALTSKIF